MRRIDKAQAGKRHRSPFLELERIYKAELELTQAKVTRAEVKADANNAEANLLAQQCRVLRQDLLHHGFQPVEALTKSSPGYLIDLTISWYRDNLAVCNDLGWCLLRGFGAVLQLVIVELWEEGLGKLGVRDTPRLIGIK